MAPGTLGGRYSCMALPTSPSPDSKVPAALMCIKGAQLDWRATMAIGEAETVAMKAAPTAEIVCENRKGQDSVGSSRLP